MNRYRQGDIVWYCECGSTIKYSGAQFEVVDRVEIMEIINRHKRMNHETIDASKCNKVRELWKRAERIKIND